VTSSSAIDVPVLIVGAGPTGLCASLFLSKHGVRSLTVERHPGTSIYPRATGINVRSMEIFRSLGLEDEVRRASFKVAARVGKSQYLVDPDPELSPSFRGNASEVSPCDWTSCSQYELEPILLRAAASESCAQLLFGTELLAFGQNVDGITARVMDLTTGVVREVRSKYLIAADGSKSRVREQLGIAMQGAGELMQNVSIHFAAPLREHLPQGPNFLHFVQNDDVSGIFLPTNGDSRWMFAVPQASVPMSSERAAELVRKGAGVPDLEVDVLGTVSWTMQADLAERCRLGSVFLAGDAAHRMTPAGGLGMNTGIQEVHNLCWKLAGVLQGWAGAAHLDTYEDERMPVARYNVARSVNLITGADAGERTALDVDLGFTYESRAVVRDSSSALQISDGDYAPNARPGSRAPHCWLGESIDRISTLDLLGPRWTLLTGEGGELWRQSADAVTNQMGMPLVHRLIGGRAWRVLYGVDECGAVLVRPDGHVAWRQTTRVSSPALHLGAALRSVLGQRLHSARIVSDDDTPAGVRRVTN
jgi:2-polyprenyl-6-methoxyphenol hydroxylase-like FAD-dependent oxidoreductase